MRKRQTLVLRRENHKHDGLGAVFLGVVEDEKEIRRALERYLGAAITILAIDRFDDRLQVTVECPGFEEESQNLVRLGRSLSQKGRNRAAADMFAEALRLDPLNVDAFKAEAAHRLAHDDRTGSEDRWIRASEIHGYDGETLRALAMIALEDDRRPTAMRYLEEALRINPDDDESQEILDQLKRQIELRFRDEGDA